MRQLYCVAGLVEMVARDRGITVFEVDNQQAKKTFFFRGGKKPTWAEAKNVSALWGLEPGNSDEADAAAVMMTYLSYAHEDAFSAHLEAVHKRKAALGEALL